MFVWKIFRSIFKRTWWLKNLNAFLKSKNTEPIISALFIAFNQVSHKWTSAVWHECFGRKPDWYGWIRLCVLRWWYICLCMCFSSGFDSAGRREMGRMYCGWDTSLVLGNGITFASLRADGKMFFSNAQIKNVS